MAALNLWKLRTAIRLGPANVARVAAYQALLKGGYFRWRQPTRDTGSSPFFTWPATHAGVPLHPQIDAAAWAADGDRILGGEVPAFSAGWTTGGFPPRWTRSVLTGADLDGRSQHWSQYDDFDLPGGDIKGYWELSRFDGLLVLALAWIASRREELRQAIETWLANWTASNPVNAGVQWKCGQEASLRALNLGLVAWLLNRYGGVRVGKSLGDLFVHHCERIEPTMSYAIAQDNNHGTSEAAALYVIGGLLGRTGHGGRRAARWCEKGRRLLENRVARLVMADGSFSQHSTNYHRMLLDTLSIAETWRRFAAERPFSAAYHERCVAATDWLESMTDPVTGDAPNLGANDGTRLFVLHRLPYRDYRPSIQWASVLFRSRPAFPPSAADEPLAWLGLPAPATSNVAVQRSRLLPHGGYATMHAATAWAMLRLPGYRFRPSHADALHLDLWVAGRNVLGDGGTFSYNSDPQTLEYFSGTASHNTVQFDGRDQMPRISRFLFGEWLERRDLVFDKERGEMGAAYIDCWGASHRRVVRLERRKCVVVDSVAGFKSKAVLRWRLMPRAWTMSAPGAVEGPVRIAVRAGAAPIRRHLVGGWESREYGRKSPLPVLEVEIDRPATITTEISWD